MSARIIGLEVRGASRPWLTRCLMATLLLMSSVAWADGEYGDPCDFVNRCTAQGMVCAIPSGASSGYCAHSCNVKQSVCPHQEACTVLSTGQGACLCLGPQDCPSNASCNAKGQCFGTKKIGEPCDGTDLCGSGLLCAQPDGVKEKRCLPLCSGLLCSNGLFCATAETGSSFSVCVCDLDSECPTGTICLDGACRKKPSAGEDCTVDSGCQAGFSCILLRVGQTVGKCHPDCTSDSSCIGNEGCTLLREQNKKVCLCTQECLGGVPCVDGLCQAQQRCSPDRTCPDGQVCFYPKSGVKQGVCVTSCKKESECPGTPCVSVGNNQKGCACRRDSDCASGGCIGFTCKTTCAGIAQCPIGKLCQSGFCVDPGPEDVLPDRAPVQDTTPSRPDPRQPGDPIPPPCDPPCEAPLVCNVITKTCEKKVLGSVCQSNEGCQSGLCFGPGAPKLSVCSSKDCSACAALALTCQTFNGVTACYTKPTPVPDKITGDPGCAGCSSQGSVPPWLMMFLVLVVLIRITSRRTSP